MSDGAVKARLELIRKIRIVASHCINNTYPVSHELDDLVQPEVESFQR